MQTLTVEQRLIEIVKAECDIENPDFDALFSELGIDSLDFAQLIQEVREKIGPFSRAQAQRCQSLRDIVKELEACQPQ